MRQPHWHDVTARTTNERRSCRHEPSKARRYGGCPGLLATSRETKLTNGHFINSLRDEICHLVAYLDFCLLEHQKILFFCRRLKNKLQVGPHMVHTKPLATLGNCSSVGPHETKLTHFLCSRHLFPDRHY